MEGRGAQMASVPSGKTSVRFPSPSPQHPSPLSQRVAVRVGGAAVVGARCAGRLLQGLSEAPSWGSCKASPLISPHAPIASPLSPFFFAPSSLSLVSPRTFAPPSFCAGVICDGHGHGRKK